MKTSELIQKLNLRVFNSNQISDAEITGGYTSDLLSDVMGNAAPGQAWLTLQTHKNVAAIASLKDLSAIVLVNNNTPENDMLEAAENEGIAVLGSQLPAFELSAAIYNALQV